MAKEYIDNKNLNEKQNQVINSDIQKKSKIVTDKLINDSIKKDKSVNADYDKNARVSKNNTISNTTNTNKIKNNNILKSDGSVAITKQLDLNKYFGYSTFLSDPEIFQKSADISASPNYKVGPGDEIIIMLWGQTEDISNYTVTRDGYIFIQNIGQVFVNGMTLGKLEEKLKKVFKKSYSSISSQNNANTFIDVSLGATVLKPIRVFVMGEVSQPGAYENETIHLSLHLFITLEAQRSLVP